MKKKYLLLLVLLLFLFGCDNWEEDVKNDYLSMKSDLIKETSFSSLEEINCDVSVFIDRIDEEKVSYEMIVENPSINMNNIKAILIHNYYTEQLFPSVGIFDDPVDLIVNSGNKITLKGEIETDNDIDSLNLVLKLYIRYVDDNGNEKDIYYKATKYISFFVYYYYGDNMKVKLFDESHESDLEDDINKFIKDEEPEIIDIKFSVSNSVYSEEQLYCFSAMIIYNEN